MRKMLSGVLGVLILVAVAGGGNSAQRVTGTQPPPAGPEGFRGVFPPADTAQSPPPRTATPTGTPTPDTLRQLDPSDSRYIGRDYAIIPDGRFDLLEEAVVYANTYPSTVYRIFLEEGLYQFGKTLTVYGQVEMYGRGSDMTTFKPGVPINGIAVNGLFTLPSNGRLRLDNLKISTASTEHYGGVAHIQGAGALLEITNCKIKNNSADIDGGAIYVGNGRLIVRNTLFKDNSADRGGAIYVYSVQPTPVILQGVSFEANDALTDGASIHHEPFGSSRDVEGIVYIRDANFIDSDAPITASNKIRKHIWAQNSNASVDAAYNYWSGPKVTPEANSKGVNTLFGVTPTYAMPIETPVPLPNDPLYNYRVVIAQTGVLAPTFDATEVAAIHTGVYNTGEALRLQFGEPGQSGAEVFREVMLDPTSGYTEIHFVPNGDHGTFCTTTAPVPGSEIMGRIVCLRDNVLTEYTVVHELGHVFSGRTSGVFRDLVNDPNPSEDLTSIRDNNGYHLLGKRSYTLIHGFVTDFQRSDIVVDNGWGSAALWNGASSIRFQMPPLPGGTPVAPFWSPLVGPCGTAAPYDFPPPSGNPYSFQQNPCTFPNWIVPTSTGIPGTPVGSATPSSNAANVEELTEAAADMFLNWVYWKLGAGGFLDMYWRYPNYSSSSYDCLPNGCLQPTGAPGDLRSSWMNQTLATLVP